MYLDEQDQQWVSRKPPLSVLLQYLGFGSLWVPKVHHLIQQFVNDDKIVPYTLFLQLLEVFRENLHNLMEE